MPPKKILAGEESADLEAWVKMGAPAADAGKGAVKKQIGPSVEEGRKLWAYRVPKVSPVPAVKDAAWALDDIDRFVLARLEAQGLHPSPAADKPVLLRRVYYD